MLGGCAAPQPKEQPPVEQVPGQAEVKEDRYADVSARIAENPVAFLREVAERTSQLKAYRLTFYRQERLGLPAQLGPLEEMRAAFRQDPFSVKLEWPGDDAPYYESVYDQGQSKGQMTIRERKGALPFLPPTTRTIDIMFPVKIGKSKNPITDFGLRRIMERTLLPFDDPEVAKVMTVTYKGVVNVEPMNRPAHYIRIDRPKTAGLAYTRQDVYIDAETLLPAGTDLFLPGDVLDARYRYSDVRTDVQLTDADFRMSRG